MRAGPAASIAGILNAKLNHTDPPGTGRCVPGGVVPVVVGTEVGADVGVREELAQPGLARLA